MLLLPLEVLLPQGVDTVNHDLDQLDLGVSQSVLVGDVVGVTLNIDNISKKFDNAIKKGFFQDKD